MLIGNGILKCYDGGYPDWNTIIAYISSNVEIELNAAPYPIQAMVTANMQDSYRRKRYAEYFCKADSTDFKNGYVYRQGNSIIKKILDLNSDAILTTNYTYEIENELCNNYNRFNESKKRNYAFWCDKKANNRIHKFNRFLYNGITRDIWHIHGETRNISSIVFTHDEYSRITSDIVEYCRSAKNKYNNFSQSINMISWIDYFIIGDLYILGFGFEYSEFDLWWLLNRRVREKADIGKVHFFIPYWELKDKSSIKYIMDQLNVDVITGKDIVEEGKYFSFYEFAINKIKKIQEGNKNEK